jgi:hypothetical protein
MILFGHVDASYLSRSHARSVAGGIFFLGDRNKPLKINGSIHDLSSIIHSIDSSAGEAECNTLLSSLVPNMPLVFALFSPTLDTLSLLQCLCVITRAQSELQLIRSNKNDPKPLT